MEGISEIKLTKPNSPYSFTLFNFALKNRAGHGRLDQCIRKLILEEGDGAARLLDLSAHRIDLLDARADANELVRLAQSRDSCGPVGVHTCICEIRPGLLQFGSGFADSPGVVSWPRVQPVLSATQLAIRGPAGVVGGTHRL